MSALISYPVEDYPGFEVVPLAAIDMSLRYALRYGGVLEEFSILLKHYMLSEVNVSVLMAQFAVICAERIWSRWMAL